MCESNKPPFLLDGIQLSKNGGIQQYQPQKDRHLKKYYKNHVKKQSEKVSQRFYTDISNRYMGSSSVISLNQSVQQNQRPSYRQKSLNRASTQNQQLNHSSSPNYNQGKLNTPRKQREVQLSLPKLDNNNNNSNQLQPITRDQLLQFLDQVMYAVENVQHIVSQSSELPYQNQYTQPLKSNKKFKVTQEQQTDLSYLQQHIKQKLQYVNKITNKKTQTPYRQQRAQTQHSESQEPILQNLKQKKLKTEFTEESDGPDAKQTRFPQIQQSNQKKSAGKILPQGKKNRIQSQVFSYQFLFSKEDEVNQKDFTNKLSSNQSQQDITDESQIYNPQNNRSKLKVERGHQSTPKQISNSKIIETQKKVQKQQQNQSQLKQTNKELIIIQQENKQEENQSIQRVSSKNYSLSAFEDADQDIIPSQGSNQNVQSKKVKEQTDKNESKANNQITPKAKKRPIHLKNPNQYEISQLSEKQQDSKTIELRQNGSEMGQSEIKSKDENIQNQGKEQKESLQKSQKKDSNEQILQEDMKKSQNQQENQTQIKQDTNRAHSSKKSIKNDSNLNQSGQANQEVQQQQNSQRRTINLEEETQQQNQIEQTNIEKPEEENLSQKQGALFDASVSEINKYQKEDFVSEHEKANQSLDKLKSFVKDQQESNQQPDNQQSSSVLNQQSQDINNSFVTVKSQVVTENDLPKYNFEGQIIKRNSEKQQILKVDVQDEQQQSQYQDLKQSIQIEDKNLDLNKIVSEKRNSVSEPQKSQNMQENIQIEIQQKSIQKKQSNNQTNSLQQSQLSQNLNPQQNVIQEEFKPYRSQKIDFQNIQKEQALAKSQVVNLNVELKTEFKEMIHKQKLQQKSENKIEQPFQIKTPDQDQLKGQQESKVEIQQNKSRKESVDQKSEIIIQNSDQTENKLQQSQVKSEKKSLIVEANQIQQEDKSVNKEQRVEYKDENSSQQKEEAKQFLIS